MMRRIVVILFALSAFCIDADAQYMTSRSIIKIKDNTRQEQREKAKAEKEAYAKAQAEAAKVIAQKEEAERIERERLAKIEAEKKEAERVERERLAKIEAEKKEAERVERERLAKIEAEKRRKLYAKQQSGFASMIDLSYNMAFTTPSSHFGVNYTAGYRFNNLLYLGAGVGFAYNLEGKASERYVQTTYSNNVLNPHTISIPIFAYFRANLLNRRCSPFVALAAGGNLSPKQTLHLDLVDVKYSPSGLFANPQIGLNFRTTTKASLYFAVGLQCFAVSTCIEYTGYNAAIRPSFGYGVDFRLGFTF